MTPAQRKNVEKIKEQLGSCQGLECPSCPTEIRHVCHCSSISTVRQAAERLLEIEENLEETCQIHQTVAVQE